MHSAEWNDNVVLENQVVGVVGTSSSGVQVIPSIAPKVKKLIVYMREPNYVVPKLQTSFTRINKFVCAIFPWLMWALRALVFACVDVGFAIGGLDAGTFTNKIGQSISSILSC
jgi:hypothetical protein